MLLLIVLIVGLFLIVVLLLVILSTRHRRRKMREQISREIYTDTSTNKNSPALFGTMAGRYHVTPMTNTLDGNSVKLNGIEAIKSDNLYHRKSISNPIFAEVDEVDSSGMPIRTSPEVRNELVQLRPFGEEHFHREERPSFPNGFLSYNRKEPVDILDSISVDTEVQEVCETFDDYDSQYQPERKYDRPFTPMEEIVDEDPSALYAVVRKKKPPNNDNKQKDNLPRNSVKNDKEIEPPSYLKNNGNFLAELAQKRNQILLSTDSRVENELKVITHRDTEDSIKTPNKHRHLKKANSVADLVKSFDSMQQ